MGVTTFPTTGHVEEEAGEDLMFRLLFLLGVLMCSCRDVPTVLVLRAQAWSMADVVFLQVPLLPSTMHMFNEDVLPKLKKGMALINTSRGGERQLFTLLGCGRRQTPTSEEESVFDHTFSFPSTERRRAAF